MEINALYEKTIQGGRTEEDELFCILSVRFRIISGHRIRNSEDAQDVVQESLAVICREFRNTVFHSSFAAWAYEVLRHRILSYYEKRDAAAQYKYVVDLWKDADPQLDCQKDARKRLLELQSK